MKMKKLAVLSIAGLMSLSIATAPLAQAMGKPQAGANQGDALLDTALSLAILYAKTDPKIGPVLAALGINGAEDIKNLFRGDRSGANFNDIISFAIANYASQDPRIQAVLDQLGIRDFSDIQSLLNGSGDRAALFQLAYDAISHDEKYSKWLAMLEISNAEDLQGLLDGGIQGGNLKDLLFRIGMAYLASKGKIDLGAFFQGVDLGAYQGLPTSEISRIVKTAKAAKAKRK
jgi:hypothetical protein